MEGDLRGEPKKRSRLGRDEEIEAAERRRAGGRETRVPIAIDPRLPRWHYRDRDARRSLTLFVAVSPVARPSVYHHHDVRAAFHVRALFARQHRAGVRPRPRRVRFQPRRPILKADRRREGDPRGI